MTDFDLESLLCAADLAVLPASRIVSARECVTLTHVQSTRSYEIRIQLGGSPTSPDFTIPSPVVGDDGEIDDDVDLAFAIPLLTPRKGELVTVDSVVDGSGDAVPLLSHDEHASVSAQIVQALLWQAARWHISQGEVSIESSRECRDDLSKLAQADPADCASIVSRRFDIDGCLRLLPGQLRPLSERRLYSFCRLISERYLILAKLFADAPSVSFVGFSVSVANVTDLSDGSLGGRWRRWLGDPPSTIRFALPMARRTSDYHLRVTGASGYYCFDQVILGSPASRAAKTRSDAILPTVAEGRKDGAAAFSRTSGAPRDAHLYVMDGAGSRDWLDAQVVWQEVPPGSAGATALSLIVTTLLILGLAAGGFMQLASGVTPAVAVVLQSSLYLVTSSIFTLNGTPSLASRLLQAAGSLNSLAFLVWWIFGGFSAQQVAGAAEDRQFGWVTVTFGVVIALTSIGLSIAGIWRLRRAAHNYRQAASSHWHGH